MAKFLLRWMLVWQTWKVVPPELMLFALGLALLVGMGAGLYPSLRAARLQPVIALKTD